MKHRPMRTTTRPMRKQAPVPAPAPVVKIRKFVDPNRPRRWDAIIRRIPTGREVIGVEVGVWVGDTAKRILEQRPLCRHVMVDPWIKPEPESRYAKSPDGVAHQEQDYYDDCFLKTLQSVEPWKERAIIKRDVSLEAVKHFEDGSLDYAFIDAEHTYEGCLEDIKAWLPKVKKGGWIGGHDLDNLPRFPGIRQAVEEVFGEDGFEVDGDHTWFVRIK